jgi:hypothetical protein
LEFIWDLEFDIASCEAIHKRPTSVILPDHASKPETLGFSPESGSFGIWNLIFEICDCVACLVPAMPG